MSLYGALGSSNEGDQARPLANGRGGSNLLSAVAGAALMLQISLQFESTSRGLQCSAAVSVLSADLSLLQVPGHREQRSRP